MTCFRLIDAKRAQHPVSLLCNVLGVSRAGYYAWKARGTCERSRVEHGDVIRIGRTLLRYVVLAQ